MHKRIESSFCAFLLFGTGRRGSGRSRQIDVFGSRGSRQFGFVRRSEAVLGQGEAAIVRGLDNRRDHLHFDVGIVVDDRRRRLARRSGGVIAVLKRELIRKSIIEIEQNNVPRSGAGRFQQQTPQQPRRRTKVPKPRNDWLSSRERSCGPSWKSAQGYGGLGF